MFQYGLQKKHSVIHCETQNRRSQITTDKYIKSSHISIMSLHVCHNVSEKVLDDSFHADHLLHLLSLSDEEK